MIDVYISEDHKEKLIIRKGDSLSDVANRFIIDHGNFGFECRSTWIEERTVGSASISFSDSSSLPHRRTRGRGRISQRTDTVQKKRVHSLIFLNLLMFPGRKMILLPIFCILIEFITKTLANRTSRRCPLLRNIRSFLCSFWCCRSETYKVYIFIYEI